MQAMKSLLGRKTVIMIAHRATTLEDCDHIYMLMVGVLWLTVVTVNWEKTGRICSRNADIKQCVLNVNPRLHTWLRY